ncbi:MAG: allantoin permease, partial [Rhizobiaceae bacterium]|nr:allantoin permease [Rhizobiaceae bacterium]
FGMPFYAMAFLVSGLFGMFMIGTVPDLGALSEVSVLLALLKLMGIWGLLFVWVTQTRINTANYYLAAVNLEALVQLFGKLPFGRIGWAIAVGAIVYVLMLADVFAYLLSALAYQGIFVVAWVAVAMAHILIDRYSVLVGGTIEYRSSHVPAFNPLGIGAWFVAAAVGIWLHVWGGGYAELSAPATAVIAFCIYAAGLTQARRSWFLAAG